MKAILLLSIALIAVAACKKKTNSTPDKKITYAGSMTYGNNILTSNTDSTVVDTVLANTDYSFGAQLGEDATLKIRITNLSPEPPQGQQMPVWFYSSSQGWTVSNYDETNNTQFFTANQSGAVILDMVFSDGPGACRLDYYENSSAVTKTKYVAW